MSWIQVALAIPLGLLAVALFHDFMAGLADERIWGRPVDQPDAAVPPAVPGCGGGDPVEPRTRLKKAG